MLTLTALVHKIDGTVETATFNLSDPVPHEHGTFACHLRCSLLQTVIPAIGVTPFGALSNAVMFIKTYCSEPDAVAV